MDGKNAMNEDDVIRKNFSTFSPNSWMRTHDRCRSVMEKPFDVECIMDGKKYEFRDEPEFWLVVVFLEKK